MSPTKSASWQQVKAHLLGEALMSETGVLRKPRMRHCRRGCGLVLFAGLDDMGLEAWCWPHPTTVPGELGALMAGLVTFGHVDGELVRRCHRRITWRDADREAVYVQHRCADPPPPVSELHRRKTRKEIAPNSPPPF